MSKTLTDSDFVAGGQQVNLEPGLIHAVCDVEAPQGGFDENGLPRILFEGHQFSRLTNHVYDQSHPTISYPQWTKRFYSSTNTGEHARLQEASALNRDAALQSASWGKFQIMGFNYQTCGFLDIQSFINAMYKDEGAHLAAFLGFVSKDRGGAMIPALREHRWADFARMYNGPGYAANKYDIKLGVAYAKYKS